MNNNTFCNILIYSLIFKYIKETPLTDLKFTFFDFRLDKFEGLRKSFLELGKTIFLSYVRRDEKNGDSDQENCVYVQRLILQSSSSAKIVAWIVVFLTYVAQLVNWKSIYRWSVSKVEWFYFKTRSGVRYFRLFWSSNWILIKN